jgi:hypothetical protein
MKMIITTISDDRNLYDEVTDPRDDFKKQNALFLLKTKEIHNLTRIATDSVVSDTTYIVRNSIELLKMGVANRLDSAGIRFDAVPGLEDLFKDDSPVNNPFSGLQGKRKQTNYYRENFGLVVSVYWRNSTTFLEE